tara:strand:- start:673 stop:1143 length:471 start_codon:yes stop_codon:yes gene_type:complete
MDTIDIVRDIVYDDTPWLILRPDDIATMKLNAQGQVKDTKKYLLDQAKFIEKTRADNKDKIRTVTVTIRKPTVADRIEIRSACRGTDGVYDTEREPLHACDRLIESWDLATNKGTAIKLSPEAIRNQLPLCVLDALWGEMYQLMYPSQARLSFLAQ